MHRGLLLPTLLVLAACSYEPAVIRRYEFKEGISHTMPTNQVIQIRVVYIEREKIHEIARKAFERDGLPFNPPYRYEGFFDYRMQTLYCEKWDAVICGHELFHATDGDWHK